jgi:hypothetical protein
MKKALFVFAAIVMMAGFSNKVMAQTEAAASSDAFATIVAPIAIVHDGNDLQFGTLIAGSGTTTVSVLNVRTFSVPEINPGDQGVTPTAAVFSVSGSPTYTYSIAFTNATENLTFDVSNTMSAGTFIASTTTDGVGLTGTLDALGDDELTVGATLTVTAGLPSGLYAGSFEVTVAYN